MSSKYHGLPDIDTAPDVFETSDEPGRVLVPSDSLVDDDALKVVPEGLDVTGLPGRSKAQQAYGRSSKRQQFRLPPLRTHTLDSESDSDEDRALESTSARLRRLKAELAEVEAEIQAGPSKPKRPEPSSKRRSVLPPRAPVDLAGELASLKERLGAVDGLEVPGAASTRPDDDEWTRRLDRLKLAERPDSETQAVGEDNDTRGNAGAVAQPISDLDQRLARLEAAIGLDGSSAPLLPSLARSDHLLSLFTQPRHLDAISRRVKLLLVDLDRAATASRRNVHHTPNLGSSPEKQPSTITLSQLEHGQLQELFNILPRLDPMLPILDPLLTRLRSLQALHAEAGEVAEGLKRLQTERKEQAEETIDMRRIVDEVQKGITEAAAGIENNWKSLDTRLGDLDERIKRLDA